MSASQPAAANLNFSAQNTENYMFAFCIFQLWDICVREKFVMSCFLKEADVCSIFENVELWVWNLFKNYFYLLDLIWWYHVELVATQFIERMESFYSKMRWWFCYTYRFHRLQLRSLDENRRYMIKATVRQSSVNNYEANDTQRLNDHLKYSIRFQQPEILCPQARNRRKQSKETEWT